MKLLGSLWGQSVVSVSCPKGQSIDAAHFVDVSKEPHRRRVPNPFVKKKCIGESCAKLAIQGITFRSIESEAMGTLFL